MKKWEVLHISIGENENDPPKNIRIGSLVKSFDGIGRVKKIDWDSYWGFWRCHFKDISRGHIQAPAVKVIEIIEY